MILRHLHRIWITVEPTLTPWLAEGVNFTMLDATRDELILRLRSGAVRVGDLEQQDSTQ